MLQAQQRRADHIVEYVLYLWAMESLIRGAGFEEAVFEAFAEVHGEEEGEWLRGLAREMQRQGLTESGHTAHAHEVLTELALLHDLLLGAMEDPVYRTRVAEAQPVLDDFRRKTDRPMHPVEQLCTALYGWWMLRAQGKEISDETQEAMALLREMANALARGHIRVYQNR
jgi:hypothetical protein